MSVAESIEAKLQGAFSLAHVSLENESHKHGVPPNSETHFKLTLVSDDFSGLMPVKRHQLVYGLLSDELKGPVHALALHLFTPEEWQARGGTAAPSPDCLGGSRHDPEFGGK